MVYPSTSCIIVFILGRFSQLLIVKVSGGLLRYSEPCSTKTFPNRHPLRLQLQFRPLLPVASLYYRTNLRWFFPFSFFSVTLTSQTLTDSRYYNLYWFLYLPISTHLGLRRPYKSHPKLTLRRCSTTEVPS